MIIAVNAMELSSQLRAFRKKAGLSLSGLAARANTSVSALSRYEAGWDRFELYTLNKIASALGCELDIKLRQGRAKKHPVKATDVVLKIKRLFWDKRLKKSDLEEYPVWIMERVVEYGDIEDIRSLEGLWGKEVFLSRVAECRFSSPKTEKFWHAILEKEGAKCTKRSLQRKVWSY